MSCAQFWQDRLTYIQSQIVVYETAITQISTPGIESYMIDTGQTITRVTKQDLEKLENILLSYMNRYAELEARCTGSNSFNARQSG